MPRYFFRGLAFSYTSQPFVESGPDYGCCLPKTKLEIGNVCPLCGGTPSMMGQVRGILTSE
jgi:hypothetical protein